MDCDERCRVVAIAVSVRGIDVLVDREHWESEKTLVVGRLEKQVTFAPAELRWSILKQNHTSYVVAYLSSPKSILLHRLLLECPVGLVCDHINGNGLDNRMQNLRTLQASQNNVNAGSRGGSSAFVGVMKRPRVNGDCFVAYTRIDGKRHHIGIYKTEHEAAIARDAYVLRHRGDLARLNFADAIPSLDQLAAEAQHIALGIGGGK